MDREKAADYARAKVKAEDKVKDRVKDKVKDKVDAGAAVWAGNKPRAPAACACVPTVAMWNRTNVVSHARSANAQSVGLP